MRKPSRKPRTITKITRTVRKLIRALDNILLDLDHIAVMLVAEDARETRLDPSKRKARRTR